MQITILGSGTSHGIPMIGCRCEVCTSTDPRDTRLRPSVLVRLDAPAADSADSSGSADSTGPAHSPGAPPTTILIDTSADFRAQALRHDITHIDAVLFTHSHADHIFGLDELRRYNVLQREAIALYGDDRTLADLRRIFDYAFGNPEAGHDYVPRLRPSVVAGPFCIAHESIVPVPILHGVRTIFGYRIGNFAYLTDCSGIPDTSWPLLEGVELLVIGALRDKPHPSHFTVEQAIAAGRRMGAPRVLFTHMNHDLGHVATCARLPAGMELSYDGMILTLPAPAGAPQ